MAKPVSLQFSFTLLVLCAGAQAQQQLPAVQVTGQRQAPVRVAGWGDTPAVNLPLQAVALHADSLRGLGLAGLAALPQLDASVSDGYNATGYYAQWRVRGFELDPRYNLRRDGLAINGETALLLFNKSGAELLKGASGLQAGTSSPAGLLNLVVKRPEGERLLLSLNAESSASRAASLDWSTSAGPVGLRLNAFAAELDPWLRQSHGTQRGTALALAWQASPTLQLEAEAEHARQRQPSQPGCSLLGDRLPRVDECGLRRNLNDSAWREPVVLTGDTASLRATQRLSTHWTLTAQALTQRLRNDDRVAFPFGCSAEGRFDRYCSDGSFDRYDFRSEHERRRQDVQRLALNGRVGAHQLQIEALAQRYRADFQGQAFNFAGSGSIFGPELSNADPSLTDENTNRHDRSRELGVSYHGQFGDFGLFAGLRHTRMQRAAVRTDGSRPSDYTQRFNTPWLGANWLLAQDLRAYASVGQGIESEVTPNRERYVDPGRALPALKSRSVEAGLKAGSQRVDWSLAAFRIARPVWRDLGACDDTPLSCRRQADGEALHQGLEAQADLKWASGGLLASLMALDAERRRASDATLNKQPPVNTPRTSARLALRQFIAPGLQLGLQLHHEGKRRVLPDAVLHAQAWTTLGASLRYDQSLPLGQLRWSLAIDNLTNTRAWRETPYQFSHSYLFPLAPRSARLELEWLL